MSWFEHKEHMKSYRAGMLGERFCQEIFGIKEPEYEIKTIGRSHHLFIVQAWQLFESLNKQYVIVLYKRATRPIQQGPRKGRPIFIESIEEAFQKHLDIYVVRGGVLVSIILEHKLRLRCTARCRDVMQLGKWGLVYQIPLNKLPVEILVNSLRYTLWGQREDMPRWMYLESMANQDGFLPFIDGLKIFSQEVEKGPYEATDSDPLGVD